MNSPQGLTCDGPFVCEICDQRFRNYHPLVIHKKIHGDEKHGSSRRIKGKGIFSSLIRNRTTKESSSVHKRRKSCRKQSNDENAPILVQCRRTKKKLIRETKEVLKERYTRKHKSHATASPARYAKRRYHSSENHFSTPSKAKCTYDRSDSSPPEMVPRFTYRCTICKEVFKRQSNLNSHILMVHEGKKPYTCDECGQGFNRRNNLSVHMRCHSDVKPLHCNICDKTYKHASGLSYHLAKHHGKQRKKKATHHCTNSLTLTSSLEVYSKFLTRSCDESLDNEEGVGIEVKVECRFESETDSHLKGMTIGMLRHISEMMLALC